MAGARRRRRWLLLLLVSALQTRPVQVEAGAPSPAPATAPAVAPAPAAPAPDPASTAPPQPAAAPAADAGAAADPGPVPAVDAALEARDAERIAARVDRREVQWLTVGDQRVLGLWLPESHGKSRGGVVLMHGSDGSVDDPAAIGPLRRALAKSGWDTLSLAMPRLAPGSRGYGHPDLQPGVQARLDAAVAFLQTQSISVVALIGQGSGALPALRVLLSKTPAPATLQAGVLIDWDASLDAGSEELLATRPRPVLDLLGARSNPKLLESAARRLGLSRRSQGAPYRQLLVPGVALDWSAHRTMLESTVRGFLTRQVSTPGAGPAADPAQPATDDLQ